MLLPHFGLVGAAIATLISYLINFYLLNYFGQKEYKVKLFTKKIGLVAIISLALYISSVVFTVCEVSNVFQVKLVLMLILLISVGGIVKEEGKDILDRMKSKFNTPRI